MQRITVGSRGLRKPQGVPGGVRPLPETRIAANGSLGREAQSLRRANLNPVRDKDKRELRLLEEALEVEEDVAVA
jgi:hypothetical protein